MQRWGWAVAFLFLGGCASIFAPNWSVYRAPPMGKIAIDEPKFEADRAYCQKVAEAWRQEVAASGVIVSAARGGLSNSASLNPIAIGVGVVAGGVDSAVAQSGNSGPEERAQFLDCVRTHTQQDSSAYVPLQE